MKLINSAVTKFGATKVVAVAVGGGIALGIATTLGCQKAYQKLKPKGLRDEDLERLVEEAANLKPDAEKEKPAEEVKAE
jgi:hypothetical protein